MKSYSPWQFAGFRIAFGLYLTVHFLALVPYAEELFSRAGMAANPALNPSYGLLPNLLTRWDTPLGATAFLAALALLAGLFTLGCLRRTCALLLWYGWACLLNRNVLISNPGIPYVGWLLLACALVPPGEPLALGWGRARPDWEMPRLLYWGAWYLLAAGYTVSGLHKLQSPSWLDGGALALVLDNPLARAHGLREALLALPPLALRLATWSALALEILFLPLALIRPARRWLWLAAVAFQLGILALVAFADLTLGMLAIHLFTFDPRWVPPAGDREPATVLFDGVCGLCNSVVDFALGEDQGRRLRFAPLQGATAQSLLGPEAGADLDSVVVVAEGRVYRHSAAFLAILARLGGPWRVLAAAGRLVPGILRDALYRFVARNRYQWFGRRETCRLPRPEERGAFLD